MHEYHHWGAKKKIIDKINKKIKRPEAAWLVEDRQNITKPENFRFNFDSNLNRKVWVPRRLDKKGRNEVASIDLEPLLRNNEKNRRGGEYFEFDEPKGRKRTERNKQEPKNVVSTAEGDVVRPASIFPTVDLKDYDVAEKTIQYIQVNHVIDKPKTKLPKHKNTSRRPNSTSWLIKKLQFTKLRLIRKCYN